MNLDLRLKKQVSAYLEHPSPERSVLRSTLDQITSKLPETAIFGGLLREFSLGNVRNFSSDVDLVSHSTSKEIQAAIGEFHPRRNRFGGFRFVVGKWQFDIWAFEETWAFREGLVRGSELPDLFDTTFFNLDAALFHLGQKKVYCSKAYLAGLASRTLELNLSENPSPIGMVNRAMRLAMKKNLAIGPSLANYILKHSRTCRSLWVNDSFVKDLNRHILSENSQPYEFAPQQVILDEL